MKKSPINLRYSSKSIKNGCAFFAFVLLLTACGTTPRSFLRYETTGDRPVWPSAPEAPRYQYVGQLSGEENIYTERNTNYLSRLYRWVTGIDSSARDKQVLQRPQAGVVDERSGRIYVSDVSRQAIFVFDEPRGTLTIWDKATRTLGFKTPIGLALEKNGQLLVADADLGIIVRLDIKGEPLNSFGEGVLKRPTGVAIDINSGRIYVTDTHAHNIKVFNDDGKLLEVIGQRGEGIGEFNFPTFITFKDNNLYVTDTMNSRVQVLNGQGEVLLKFGNRGIYIGDLPRPKGIGVDGDGNIYVVESYYDHLLVYSIDGQFLLPIGGTGNEIGHFYLPAGVWTDSRNRIYVADMFNGRVVIFQYLGNG